MNKNNRCLISLAVERSLDSAVANFGDISLIQARIILLIYNSPSHCVYFSDIQKKLNLTRYQCTRNIVKLTKTGVFSKEEPLLVKEADPEGGSKKLARLSPKAILILDQIVVIGSSAVTSDSSYVLTGSHVIDFHTSRSSTDRAASIEHLIEVSHHSYSDGSTSVYEITRSALDDNKTEDHLRFLYKSSYGVSTPELVKDRPYFFFFNSGLDKYLFTGNFKDETAVLVKYTNASDSEDTSIFEILDHAIKHSPSSLAKFDYIRKEILACTPAL